MSSSELLSSSPLSESSTSLPSESAESAPPSFANQPSPAFQPSASPPPPFTSRIFAELKHSLTLSFPLIASEITFMLSGFAGTVMVAHLGKVELAANALVSGIYMAALLFFFGLFNAVSIMTAQSFGARDDRAIGRIFKQGIIMAILFALPMMLFMWCAPAILVWVGQDPVVIEAARPYFYALIWPALPLNILIVVNQFLMGINRTRLVLLMSVLIVPLDILFFYLFIFGKFGLPKLGLAGIGYSVLVADLLVVIYFICYLVSSQRMRPYRLFERWWQIDRKFLFELIRIGLPLGFIYSIELALFALVAIMMGLLGTNTLAAYQISYQYLMVGLAVIFGLTQAATVRVGNEVGRDNRAALKLAMLVNMGIGFCVILVLCVIYVGFPALAISVDVDIHSIALQPMIKEAERFLAMVGIMLFSDCFRIISLGALRGLKDTKFPLFGSIIGFWCIAFPLSYLLAFRLKWGGVGIWWGLFIGLTIAGIILFVRFNRLVTRADLASMVTKG